jgi:hypothetical protein
LYLENEEIIKTHIMNKHLRFTENGYLTPIDGIETEHTPSISNKFGSKDFAERKLIKI